MAVRTPKTSDEELLGAPEQAVGIVERAAARQGRG